MEYRAVYGSETWTMRKGDIKRLEAFEMWIWRRMEKISWAEHITNEKVLAGIGDDTHTKKKTKEIDSLLRTVIEVDF